MHVEDTIVALATPEGRSALAIIRLSGNQAVEIVEACLINTSLVGKKTRTTHIGSVGEAPHQPIDQVVITLFLAPYSYTGEDVVEISCHGSPYIVRAILVLCCKKGARLAKAGEFTQRAFLNKKLDLAQAEGVASLIASETKEAHRIAMQQMKGSVSQKMQHLREQLLQFAAQLELELDFSEEDVEFADRDKLCTHAKTLLTEIQRLMDCFFVGNALKEGVQVVLIGAPNAGKSTLFNALLEEEKAIVSEEAGTTRDYLEGRLIINGVVFQLTDTAGLRKNAQTIEQAGIEKTYARMQQAAVLLLMVDLSTYQPQELAALRSTYKQEGQKLLVVGNKIDLLSKNHKIFASKNKTLHILSAKNGIGLGALKQALYDKTIGEGQKEGALISHIRHYELLKEAHEVLKELIKDLQKGQFADLLAISLRVVLRKVGEITGEVYTEDILAHIFSKFCIGK